MMVFASSGSKGIHYIIKALTMDDLEKSAYDIIGESLLIFLWLDVHVTSSQTSDQFVVNLNCISVLVHQSNEL